MNSTGPNDRLRVPQVALSAGALLALPLLIHFGAVSGLPMFLAAALGLLLLPVLYADLRQRRLGRSLLAFALVAVLWFVFGGLPMLYAVPVLIHLFLCGLFGLTLLPGRKPLISAYVEVQYESVPAAMYRYTRRVTAVWAGFFALMALQSLLLALFAPVQIWSLFVNFINYVFVLVLFLAEYTVRKRVFHDRRHASFPQFLRTLARTDFRQLLKQST